MRSKRLRASCMRSSSPVHSQSSSLSFLYFFSQGRRCFLSNYLCFLPLLSGWPLTNLYTKNRRGCGTSAQSSDSFPVPGLNPMSQTIYMALQYSSTRKFCTPLWKVISSCQLKRYDTLTPNARTSHRSLM